MSYGLHPYGGVAYAASDVAEIPQADTQTIASIEVAFTTGALETPVWEDITSDVRFWDVQRGRSRELERHQPGRATIVLSNLSRQYDSTYAAGPHFGDLRPMRRVRIRETFNGVTYPVFDGFVDRWVLDYPDVGKDATATLTATDAFKVFNRTELPRSVYTYEVEQDAPVLWWRVDEPQTDPTTTALNSGSLGSVGNGTYVGPPKAKGAQGLIFHDPGSAVEVENVSSVANKEQGIEIANSAFNIGGTGSWAIEFWATPYRDAGPERWVQGESASAGAARMLVQNATNQTWQFRLVSTAPVEYGVQGGTVVPFSRNHIVAKFGPNKAMAIYVNGVRSTTTASGTTAPPLVGSVFSDMSLGFLSTFNDLVYPTGIADEFAVYTSAEAVDPLPDARISAHYAAGTTPWQGDLPSERMDRVLDLVGYDARELDPGLATFQSANLEGQTALEHLQKAAETDFGLLFVARDGTARFVDRSTQAIRQPGTAVYGDGAGEVGYRSIRPDDGDEVIRNSATISRYNGVAQTATGATIDEFGRFQYTLDGLLHDSDFWSAAYAGYIVDEYSEPRRRIVELRIGPPKDGEEDVYLPAMLGPELGDAITVTHTPNGVGDPFEQVCVVEGITHTSAPGRNRTTTFALSPEFSEAPMIWQTWTPTLANLTQGSGTIVARYAQIGKTVHYRFKFTLGSGSAVGTGPTFTLPVTAATTYTSPQDPIGQLAIVDTGTANWVGQAFAGSSGTTCTMFSLNAADNLANITSSAPMTWASGDILACAGSYEAA